MPGAAARILVVDDEESFRYTAAKALEAAGFVVDTAPDYRRALELLEQGEPIDVLVTDVIMPERVHGFALARMARMRKLDLKVIYVTAYDVPEVEGVGRVLRKPLSDEQLINEVRRALAP
jgi:CheY-like chemotaxis protein